MHPDNPDGSFSAAEIARLQADGVIEIVEPGTPDADAFDLEVAADLPAYDAHMVDRDGPDALTSDRLLRQEAIKAELDPDRVGSAFAAWCTSRGWERSDLADHLGVTVDQLAAMALLPRAEGHLAERYGADRDRLATVLAG